MQKKKWKLRTLPCNAEKITELSRQYGIPPVVSAILLKRGVESFSEYISPELGKLHDPFLMKGMEQAVCRIQAALKNNETIAVYGDYDVDGITSTAALTKFLRTNGAEVFYYIPDRLSEGYGLNRRAVSALKENGANLVITVDCGITAVQEVDFAKSLGMDMIITDHHECKSTVPAAAAVLNPKQPDCPYPFKKLAGIGVVFKLLQALSLALKLHMQALFDEYIDIVALGTIADVMPLSGENRIIVKNGLKQLVYTENRGMRALIRQAGADPQHITAGTVGFTLAPRINAAGRIGSPGEAVELLLSAEERMAAEYARRLDEQNRIRQEIEQTILEEALAILSEEKQEKSPVIILAKEGWHHGIIGIVASKITERFYKPCILISLEQGVGKGSGRSIKSFNLFAALSGCSEYLVKFGGHELAAGLTVDEQQLPAFKEAMNRYAASILQPEDFIPELTIDAELPLAYMNLNTVEKLAVMAPYGMENPSPVFVCRGLSVISVRTVGEGKHLRLQLSDGRYAVCAIGFSMGELAQELAVHDIVDIVFTLDINTYRGERQVQIQLKDLRLAVHDEG